MNEILIAENIEKTYYLKNETINVLQGIDLKVEQGKFIVIFGPSGSGKSTLLNILGSLDRPTRGRVFFNNIDLFTNDDETLSKIRNKYIGFVFQFHHLLPEFTVLENVLLPAYIGDGDIKLAKERAFKILDELGIYDKKSRLPDELSGGERQRVAIARALINDPLLLLADEPTGNLDYENTNKLMEMFLHLKSEERTIILVTHSLEIVRLGDIAYNLKEGRLYAM
ncbi:MAG: ABC transporter ATP-binding protein [candidate division WOR-3 bacterium]|nr:ABC transporter ATP-binding protein [candidate division WOR-3 bacterium]